MKEQVIDYDYEHLELLELMMKINVLIVQQDKLVRNFSHQAPLKSVHQLISRCSVLG